MWSNHCISILGRSNSGEIANSFQSIDFLVPIYNLKITLYLLGYSLTVSRNFKPYLRMFFIVS